VGVAPVEVVPSCPSRQRRAASAAAAAAPVKKARRDISGMLWPFLYKARRALFGMYARKRVTSGRKRCSWQGLA